MHGKQYKMHVISQTGLTLIALSPGPGGGGELVILLHSFRSNTNNNILYLYTSSREETLLKGFASSWVTLIMYSLICWWYVFLVHPRRLETVIVRSMLTVFTCFLWTCPNQRRRPLLITSSIGANFDMRQISSFRM